LMKVRRSNGADETRLSISGWSMARASLMMPHRAGAACSPL
jgi:hypothetical protein